ncbi:hypothetical protein AMTR_s00004p00135940 [Amborella trichopoda]|uniref:Uncharacterized protein n=1 Tax=Amborella trichopoda TaxID=13333 RepID=W1NEQ7_AMBTC|nr:hypothetical protein AMTR_s00004p00135940 [Amborella trichopoda]
MAHPFLPHKPDRGTQLSREKLGIWIRCKGRALWRLKMSEKFGAMEEMLNLFGVARRKASIMEGEVVGDRCEGPCGNSSLRFDFIVSSRDEVPMWLKYQRWDKKS